MSFPSLYAFFRDSALLGLILLLAFMCEKHPLHPQGGKEWDPDMYWFLCLLLLVASAMTMRKVRPVLLSDLFCSLLLCVCVLYTPKPERPQAPSID